MASREETAVVESPTGTLVLGISDSGQIVQCSQNAAAVLGLDPLELLGRPASDFVAPDDHERLAALLAEVSGGAERNVMLKMRHDSEGVREAVVTAQPMAAAAGPSALLHVRVALPTSSRYQDPGQMRRALMDDSMVRFGASLDLDQTARELTQAAVPDYCTVATVLVLESLVAADEVHSEAGSAVLRRLAITTTEDCDPMWHAAFPMGEVLVYPEGTPYRQCLATGLPVHLPSVAADDAAAIARRWRRRPVTELLTGVSMVLLPLISEGTLLGLLVCTRVEGNRRFDAYDVKIGMEFAQRAAIAIDKARLFSRERATALTLQRSLLPHRLSAPTSVEVRHRYLPGSKLVEVGGDWYESLALPGGRVALIVGDVAGHGVRAAVTMGRLRTALHTLANLEFPPAQALHVLHELMLELGEQEPHFATCVYAVYDATTGMLEVASAGHLPPLLVRPDGTNQYLEVPPAPPLGVAGDDAIESREFKVDDGSVFVIYTDGLVENRGQDIDDGLARLRSIFGPDTAERSMEDLAKATLDGVYDDQNRDDIAVLIARLHRLPDDRCVAWDLPGDPAAVRRARGLVRGRLAEWGLADLSPTMELMVSELVTNAQRHAAGPLRLRLLYERTLMCEVLDRSAALPQLRSAADDEETGRGLLVVSRLANRWGSRRTATGKVVWCDLAVPGADTAEAEPPSGWPGERHHRG